MRHDIAGTSRRREYRVTEYKKRKAGRAIKRYTVFRHGNPLSSFAYPLDKAQEIFADLLAAHPDNKLDVAPKLSSGPVR